MKILSKTLFILLFGLVLFGASITAPANKLAPSGAATDAGSAPIVLAQFVPCPNGRCRR
jgi:hypothetical protein